MSRTRMQPNSERGKEGEVVQIQGKENKAPISKYHPYIWEWLKLINQETTPNALIVAPPEVLMKLANDGDYRTRADVARNKNTPPEALVKLADDGDSAARQEVAGNPNTPPEVLMTLADNNEYFIREEVAYNKNTPPEVLMKLADDGDYHVRFGVAKNPNTPPEALSQNESFNLTDFFPLLEYQTGAPGSHAKRGWADSSWSNMNYPKTSKTPVSDLRFWDVLDRDNVYMMTGLDEFEDEQKDNADKKDEEDDS